MRDIQRNSFNEQVLNINQDECVILLDYTRFHETSKCKVHDLNFTLYFKSPNDTLCHEFIDFFSEAEHDWNFTREGLRRLNTMIDLTTYNGGIYIWADNAFHNHKVLCIIRNLAINLQNTITLSFFAPHHGWSICDTHFGHGKTKLRKEFSLDLIQTLSDIVDTFKKLQNTTVEIIEQIPKQVPPREKFRPETGNMTDHYF